MAKNKIGLLGLSNTTLLLIGGGIALYLFSIKKTETISGLKKNKLSKKVKEELLEDYIYFIGLGYSKKDSILFDISISNNEAFLLKNPITRERFIERYKKTAKLYYKGQPDFNEVLNEIGRWVVKL